MSFQKYRFYITINSSDYEVFPLNFLKTSIKYSQEDGKVFYRNKFNGSLTFGTHSSVINEAGLPVDRYDDWELFWLIEQVEPCQKLGFEITRDGVTYWTGYFSTSDGAFDLDKCTFTVTPLTQDDYSVFAEEDDVEYNIHTVYSGITPITTSMTKDVTTYTYTRCYLLTEVIEYIIDQIVPGAILSSTFLNNAINSVTLATNHYRYVTISQKSDIKRPESSNPATRIMISFNSLMEILKCMNLYWTYDAITNIVTVEHFSFFTHADGEDLRTQAISEASNKYSYLKEKMPKYEKFAWMEASDSNFIEHEIWYDLSCVNPDEKSNISKQTFNVTTDIEYIQQCMANDAVEGTASNISDEGFVLLANKDEGGTFYIYQNRLSFLWPIVFNGDFGWPLLHNGLFKHGRVLIEGYMNGALTTFYSAQKNKKQDTIAIFCDPFDPSELITTELGEIYFAGAKGQVKTASMEPTGKTKLTLLYGPPDNPITPVIYDEYMIQITEVCEFIYPELITETKYYAVASENVDANVTIDIELYIGDVFANNCNTGHYFITIPAGTKTGNVTIPWCDPGNPLDQKCCRWVTIWSITGGIYSWSNSVTRAPYTQWWC